MRLLDPAGILLGGELGDRLRRAINHLRELNTAEMRRELASPDGYWHWGADYMGRWVGTMSLLERQTGQDYGVETVAHELIGYQETNGSFGRYSEPHDYKEWFGMGRGLVGLLDYHVASGDPSALESACRLGDYYLREYPDSAAEMYECYASGLDGLVRLAKLTGQERYAKIACRVAETSMVFRQEWYSSTIGRGGRRAPCAGQVHCQLLTARGLLDLYELSGEEAYLRSALALHEFIANETLSISGGVGFYFNRPHENETCSDADWLRLNLQLWRIIGGGRYLDLAETTLVNQLYFAQIDSGAFSYLRGLNGRPGATFDACCSHHGPRAIWEALQYAFTADNGGVSMNLPLTLKTRLSLMGNEIAISSDVRSDVEQMTVSLSIDQATGQAFKFRARIPGWAGEVALRVNGEPVEATKTGGYAECSRFWQTGDVVEVVTPQRIRVELGHRLGRTIIHADELAVFLGPRLFAMSDHHNVSTDLHRIRVSAPDAAPADFHPSGGDRIECEGVLPSGRSGAITLTPLAEVGGIASGKGRAHPIAVAPYRVWLPVAKSRPKGRQGRSATLMP